jgi:prepilin-type N-terminal cleavage/methylation domain-containing protein
MIMRSPALPPGRRNAGFTLLELLGVMAIILVLMGIIVGISAGVMKELSRSRARAELQELHNALQAYRTDKGELPVNVARTNELLLVRDRLPEKVRQVLNRRSTTKTLDPWKREYLYLPGAYLDPAQPETYILYSTGPRTEITEDDIVSGK